MKKAEVLPASAPLASSLGFSQRRAGRVAHLVSRSHHYPDCTAPWTTVVTEKWRHSSECFRTDFHIALMPPISALILQGAPAFTVGVPLKVRRTSWCLALSCLVATVWISDSFATWHCQTWQSRIWNSTLSFTKKKKTQKCLFILKGIHGAVWLMRFQEIKSALFRSALCRDQKKKKKCFSAWDLLKMDVPCLVRKRDMHCVNHAPHNALNVVRTYFESPLRGGDILDGTHGRRDLICRLPVANGSESS